MSAQKRVITDLRLAAFLADRARSRYLAPFLARERSLTQAAGEMRVSESRTSYWVGVLLKLGLVAVARTEKRYRYTRRYRSVAACFVAPLDLVPVASDEALLEGHFADIRGAFSSLARVGRRNARWHRYFRREALPAFQIVPESGALEDARILNTWARPSLSAERAGELRGALEQLLADRQADVHQVNARGGKTYLIHLGVVEEAVSEGVGGCSRKPRLVC